MGLTGKYDFPGIKKVNAAGIRALLRLSPWTAWLASIPAISAMMSEALGNWIANKGLVVLNVGAAYVEGELDQKGMDKAMDKAIGEITTQGGREKLTPEQKKAIDDKIISAARKLIVVARH